MIILYTFGPYFGLPDGSPFVTKAMLLLKFAGLSYSEDRGGYFKSPKKKLPYINDDGTIIADSTFIRLHIEKKYGFDFDAGLNAEQRAIAWAVEKMCEEHLYFAMLEIRWRDVANFNKGPAHFFDSIPLPLRPLVRRMIRGKIIKTLNNQGIGRHTKEEVAELACRDIEALATLLGDKPFLMGDKPCGADATVFAFVAGLLAPIFETRVRTTIQARANLVAYATRISELYFLAGGQARVLEAPLP
jgi:glutathione S-transferase